MRSAVAQSRTNRRTTRANEREAGQSNGATLTPPAYGIDLADQTARNLVRREPQSQSPPVPTSLHLVSDTTTQLTPEPLPVTETEAPATDIAPFVQDADAATLEIPPVVATPTGEQAEPVELLMPEPPEGFSETDQQHLQSSGSRARAETRSQAALPAASESVSEARQAVEEPVEETAARANAGLAEALGEQPQPSPEIEALCQNILRAIRERRPPDEDSLLQTNPREEAEAAGSALQSSVESGVDSAESNYDQLNSSPQGAPQQQSRSIDSPSESVNSRDLGASEAVPEAVPDENVSLDADVEASATRMEDAGMGSEPAQLVQNGPIAEARTAQGELTETAQRDPAEVLAEQQAARDGARNDMAELQQQALEALQTNRAQTVGGLGAQQLGMVESEQQMRTRISNEAQTIFNDAQMRVNNLLEPLTRTATQRWESGVEVLSTQFENDLASIQRWVDERHSGIGGAIVGVVDSVVGLPHWIIAAYNRAERNFGQGVCRLLRQISTEVNSVIATCELIIDNANRDIGTLFTSLPASLQEWAAGEQARFSEQLDSLHDRVTSTRDDFNRDLSERASQSVQEVRERIHELRQAAGGLLGRVAAAIEAFVDDPAKFILEGLLELVGIPPASFWALVNRIESVIDDIADNPLGFANNLAAALGQGFQQFFDNFRTHVVGGFFDWLFSGLGAVGVQLPSDFSPASLITFFLQLMGITWENIREILARHIGEENVALIEKAYELISALIEQGPEGIFEMIKEQLNPSAMLTAVMDAAIDFMIEALISAVTPRVIAMFNPAGAIIQAIEVIYRILAWVFNNAARIFSLLETVVNGAAELIAGNFTGMATAIEESLARIIAPVIDFLAGFLGLGNLPKSIAETIGGFQQMVLGVIERVVAWLAGQARSLLRALGIGEDQDMDEDPEEQELGAVDLSDLNEPPVSAERTPQDMELHLQRVHQLLSIISRRSDDTDDIESYFPRIKARYRVQTLEFDEVGPDQLGINVKINPEEPWIDWSKDIKVKADDGDEVLSAGEMNDIDYATKSVSFSKRSHSFSHSGVGTRMTAKMLAANHSQGSTTRSNNLRGLFRAGLTRGLPTSGIRGRADNEIYVRGHLLNGRLGGEGEDENLYPITQQANKNHESQVESFVKELVNEKGLLVKYEVVVDELPSAEYLNSKFVCTVHTYEINQGKIAESDDKKRVVIRSIYAGSPASEPEDEAESELNVEDVPISESLAGVGENASSVRVAGFEQGRHLVHRRARGESSRGLITDQSNDQLAGLLGVSQSKASEMINEVKSRNERAERVIESGQEESGPRRFGRRSTLARHFGLTESQTQRLESSGLGLYRRIRRN